MNDSDSLKAVLNDLLEVQRASFEETKKIREWVDHTRRVQKRGLTALAVVFGFLIAGLLAYFLIGDFRQLVSPSQQAQRYEDLLDRSDENMYRAAEQTKRFEEIQNRWEKQTDRVEALIRKWEKATSKE
jgi:hypothetical protein